MLDDDIVCLGSRSASSPQQRPVTGIVLHVDKSGSAEPYNMLFRRAITSVVQIGRRSGYEPERNDDHCNAMFRCAVVSRKHAKIAFSDRGHAYLIDLGSHHGTHIRKRGEKFSKTLKPETSTMLSDGDIVTFGKAVGKGEECVRPVVARIEVMYGTPLFKPLVVPTSSPFSSDKSIAKSSSGRYGINSSPSSSSDESYSSYSDIEEIPAPSSITKPADPQNYPISDARRAAECPSASGSQNQSQNQVASAYSVFKRLFPPAMRRLPSVTELMGDAGSSFFNSSSPPAPTRVEEEPESMPTSPGPEYDNHYAVPFSADIIDQFQCFSPTRSFSPMDLASPWSSPPAEVIVSRPLSIPPSPIGLVRLATPPPLPEVPAEEGNSNTSDISAMDSSSEQSENDSASRQMGTPLDTSLPEASSSSSIANSTTPPPIESTHSQSQSAAEIAEIMETLKHLETSVSKLQSSRRKYKARFNSNVSFISLKLSEFDDKLAEVDAEYNVLCDQFEGVQNSDLPDISAQVEELRERVDEALDRERHNHQMPDAQPLEERDDVKACLKTLHDLVDEMRTLRDRTQAEMSTELLEIKAMREEAMKDVAQVKAAAAATIAIKTPILTSLKRKRDDTDENGDVADDDDDVNSSEGVMRKIVNEDVAVLAEGSEDKDVVMDGTEVEASVPLDLSPPRKRAKRIMSVVGQAATAVTIGAVVTWSALAFS